MFLPHFSDPHKSILMPDPIPRDPIPRFISDPHKSILMPDPIPRFSGISLLPAWRSAQADRKCFYHIFPIPISQYLYLGTDPRALSFPTWWRHPKAQA